MLSELEVEDGVPISAFGRSCGFRQDFQVFAGEDVVVEAFVPVSESAMDAGYQEMKSDESANDSVFSSHL